MKLVPDWRRVLARAWSIRLITIAFVLTTAEVALPLADGLLPIPPGTFAVLSGLATAAAFCARLIVQKSVRGDEA